MTVRHGPERYHRRSIRLRGYDYRQRGAYFVTIVAQDRHCLFGNVDGNIVRLNEAGRVARMVWEEIPAHFPHVELDAFVVMPNHIHGIIVIASNDAVGTTASDPPHVGATHVGATHVGATHASPLRPSPEPSRPSDPRRSPDPPQIGATHASPVSPSPEPSRPSDPRRSPDPPQIGATHASPVSPSPEPSRPSDPRRPPDPPDMGATHMGATHASPLPLRPSGPPRRSIGAIVGSYKSVVSKRINELRGTPGAPVWQRNYYEHIIRDASSLNRIREYIANNPARWAQDADNPDRIISDRVQATEGVRATHASPKQDPQ